jgi:dTDP-4-amino-4,6-dideoxygalactose transaminase
VVTNDTELQDKIRILRDHGQIRKYHHVMVGWNCRMDGIQAAVLRIKLRHLERANQLRRSHAAHYDRTLDGIPEIVTPTEMVGARHVYHIYAVRVQDRDEVIRFLAKKGIQCGVHYPVPIHLQEAYRDIGYQPRAFPIAERCASEFVSLPMFPELSPAEVELIVGEVKAAVTVNAMAEMETESRQVLATL